MCGWTRVSSLISPVSLSPSRRAWLRFKRNRLGYWSLIAFCALVLLSLCAELVSSERPLVVRYQGQTYFPLLKDYPETTFGNNGTFNRFVFFQFSHK